MRLVNCYWYSRELSELDNVRRDTWRHELEWPREYVCNVSILIENAKWYTVMFHRMRNLIKFYIRAQDIQQSNSNSNEMKMHEGETMKRSCSLFDAMFNWITALCALNSLELFYRFSFVPLDELFSCHQWHYTMVWLYMSVNGSPFTRMLMYKTA